MRQVYVPAGTANEGLYYANALSVELANYGIKIEDDLFARISSHDEVTSQKYCASILKTYTLGQLNQPLFNGWESRTRFTLGEYFVQITAYIFKFSGNDLYNPNFMDELRANVDFGKMKKLKLVSDDKSVERFESLVNSTVPLDRKNLDELVKLAELYYLQSPNYIKSNEARIAVLLGLTKNGMRLSNALKYLNCNTHDVLRYAAGRRDFDGVKLPADVKYASLTWVDRIAVMEFLSDRSISDLCEDMGNNREAWNRFFKHTHLFSQKGFEARFTKVVASAFLSKGSKLDAASKVIAKKLRKHSKIFDVTESGNVAYRTFASRVQTCIDNKDFDGLHAEVSQKPNYLFRNLGSLSNVCTKNTEGKFVEMVLSMIDKASASVLLSLIQIDVRAKFRIIDSKGNTTVTPADYNPVIGEIQGVAEREIYRRYGFEGKVKVAKKLKTKIVPFLSTNAELDRGTRIKFEDTKNLYFLMHWVEKPGRTTDLDHSYVALDKNWAASTIYFGAQANSYIAHGGDILSAPAPNGATEYGKIRLDLIPEGVNYIVPIINVYSGDVFSENTEAYAGFMFSDSDQFSLKRDHVRYDLSQPAQVNIPFVIDVKKKEVIIVDFNNRLRNGMTAHSSINEIKNIISALKTKKFMTVERFAKILSGDKDEVSLKIKATGDGDNEVSINDLQSLLT